MFALAFTMSSSFTSDRDVALDVGESARLAGYQVTYQGLDQSREGNGEVRSARLLVERDGRSLGVYAPAITRFPNSTQAIGTPSVRTGLREDLYLTIVQLPDGDGPAVIGIRVNPMVLWLWIGAGIMAAGTALALLNTRGRTATGAPTAPESTAEGDGREPALAGEART